MNRKIPPDAFAYYASLGPQRSYQAVATQYGVSKRAVTGVADREQWQERMMTIEREARQKADEKVLETLEDMNVRHLKVLRYIQSKAIEALKAMPLDSAMDAVRAFGLSLDKERTIRGEPSDRTAVDLAQVTREEMQRFLVAEPAAAPGPTDSADDADW